jgi:hypothetical protein
VAEIILADGLLESLGQWGKILIGAVGFLLGALCTGWLVRLLAAVMTPGKKVPTVPLIVIRVLGGVVVGWLAILLFSGGGGSGFGGGNGGFGLGNGQRDATNDHRKDHTDSSADKDRTRPPTDKPLEIEVLGPPFDRERCYRIKELTGSRLLTLKEVKDKINPNNGAPWKVIELILYDDSPSEDTGPVAELKTYAEELRLKGGGKVRAIPRRKPGEAPPK